MWRVVPKELTLRINGLPVYSEIKHIYCNPEIRPTRKENNDDDDSHKNWATPEWNSSLSDVCRKYRTWLFGVAYQRRREVIRRSVAVVGISEQTDERPTECMRQRCAAGSIRAVRVWYGLIRGTHTHTRWWLGVAVASFVAWTKLLHVESARLALGWQSHNLREGVLSK